MRNSNSRDKPSTTTYTQNRLMKTQLPPKSNTKQALNSTQYRLPPTNTPSIKRIQSTKSTNGSTKQIPKQDVNFDIENNMTESKIISAKESLQLLKKKMNRTGMSREKTAGTGLSSHTLPTQQKTLNPPESMKKIKSQTNKNIDQYEQSTSYNNKNEQQRSPYNNSRQNAYEPQSYKAPNKKPTQTQQQQRPLPTKKPQQKNDSYYNQAQQVPIVRKQTFEEILERELRKEQAAKKMTGNNMNPGQKPQQQMSEYPDDSEELYECSKGCGRQFNANVISKHEKVCQKVFQQKRKVFNTAEQRKPEIEGFNLPSQKTNSMNQTKKPAQKKNKVPKWKLQSAQLRAGLKSVGNQPLTAEEQALTNMQKDSLVQCSFCGRKFNQDAANRHIPVCEKKSKQMHRPSNGPVKKR